MDWQAIGGICNIALAIINILLFIAVLCGLIYAGKQISLIKATNTIDVLVRLDERLCSQENKNLLGEMTVWDPKSIPPDKKISVDDLLGIFELIGLTVERGYVPLEDAEIMFGSALLRIYDDHDYKTYIDRSPLYFNYTRKFVDGVRKIRKEREKRLRRETSTSN